MASADSENHQMTHDQSFGCGILVTAAVVLFLSSIFWSSFEDHHYKKSAYQQLMETCLVSHIRSNNEFGMNFQSSVDASQYGGKFGGLYGVPVDVETDDEWWIFGFHADGKTSIHSPAIPFLISILQRFTGNGRDFLAGVGFLLFLATCVFLVYQMWSYFGVVAGLVLLLTLSLDIRLHQASTELLIMSLVTFALLLAMGVIASPAQATRSIWRWPLIGCSLGCSTMLQETFPLVLIPLAACLFVGIALAFVSARRKREPLNVAEPIALLAIGFFVTAAPWWVRNCNLNGEFSPLGGAINTRLVGGYCEKAVNANGNLSINEVLQRREAFMNATEKETLAEQELAFAKENWTTVNDWISNNTDSLPQLALGKAMHHLDLVADGSNTGAIQAGNGLLMIFGLVGIVICWRRIGWVLASAIFASILVTAMTWSESGRLFLPFRPMLHIGIAAGVGECLRWRRKKQSQNQ
jgi:4-amino-4-deoxy-L-arabinose transferase-like glycosyltransferase